MLYLFATLFLIAKGMFYLGQNIIEFWLFLFILFLNSSGTFDLGVNDVYKYYPF